jgi:hypothetical protein
MRPLEEVGQLGVAVEEVVEANLVLEQKIETGAWTELIS